MTLVRSDLPRKGRAKSAFLLIIVFLFGQGDLISSACEAFEGETLMGALEKPQYPEIGIFSTERLDHVRLYSALGNEWKVASGKDSETCKYLNEEISLEVLQRLVVFEESDLVHATKESAEIYGKSSSLYMQTCNYIGGHSPRIFTWGRDKNTYLEWDQTDAFIDTEHTLLLLDFLDESRTRVRAMVVNKKHQAHANKAAERRKKSWLDWLF